ncbi:hypothetical protein FGRMN_6310 [Fusarium graminum]|nr:hypothetical protein FGRMN_6310 [Fusarium graminum]
MCYIRVIHFTLCDTRRPAIINIATGNTVYHPLEPPEPCEHHDIFFGADCPYHGTCCTPGQIRVCNVKGPGDVCRGWQAYHEVIDPGYMHSDGLLAAMQPIPDWDIIETNSDLYFYEEDIRNQFFDLGAHMFEVARRAAFIVEFLLESETYSPEEEACLVEEHGELYVEWITARDQMIEQTEIWELLASVGCMEVCPAQLLTAHPWYEVFKECVDRQAGFPQFAGIPFVWLENVERRHEILNHHPQFSWPNIPEPQPARVDHLWQSPAPPQRWEPVIQRPAQDPDVPYPGEWAPIFSDLHSRRSSSSSRDAATWTSNGRDVPPYLVPYREEPDMGFMEICWDAPAALADSPLQSPFTMDDAYCHEIYEGVVSPRDVTFTNYMPGNPFNDEFETEWEANYELVGPEEVAVFQYLRVEAPSEKNELHCVSSETALRLKRRSSKFHVANGEGEVQVKRRRTA